jgi:hypothetical protein
MFLLVVFNLFALCFVGCETTVMQKENYKKVQRAENIMLSQPAPEMKFSMDRYILSERLTRFNDPNKLCYLYLVFCDGTWLQTTIIGKMTSTSKRLTSPEIYTKVESTSWAMTAAPDEMATYGSSDPAHVGLTTLGSLIEAGGFMSYIYSETPLIFKNMNKTMVEMVVQVTDQERKDLNTKLENLKQKMSGQ